MPITRIAALDDPRLAAYRNLKATNDTRWTQTFIAEGDKLVRRLLASRFAVESLLVAESYLAEFATLVRDSVEIYTVPDAWIDDIVGFNFHRGVLACARRATSATLAELCSDRQQPLTLVICPDVQDPENLGSILRIASAFGIDGVVLGSECCDPFSRRVLRVSMGAALRVPIVESDTLPTDLVQIRRDLDVRLWATVAHAEATPFDRLERPRRLAILLGSEGHGLADAWLALCERQVTIPMQPGVDSLNVAVAAGVLLYHLTRAGGGEANP